MHSYTAKKAKVWSNDEILRCLEEYKYHDHGEVVTQESLRTSFLDEISFGRCNQLLQDVDANVRSAKMQPDVTTDDILRLVGRVDQNVRELLSDYHEDKHEEKTLNLKTREEFPSPNVPKSMISEHTAPIPEMDFSRATAKTGKEVTILTAKMKRLEMYTAYRMDMVEDKLDRVLSRLEHLPLAPRDLPDRINGVEVLRNRGVSDRAPTEE